VQTRIISGKENDNERIFLCSRFRRKIASGDFACCVHHDKLDLSYMEEQLQYAGDRICKLDKGSRRAIESEKR
jgi:hypothetical protein